MQRLDPAAPTGAFQIDGQPAQRGSVKVTYAGISISLRDEWGPIWDEVPFDSIINGSTGSAFASLADLKTFVDAHFYEL